MGSVHNVRHSRARGNPEKNKSRPLPSPSRSEGDAERSERRGCPGQTGCRVAPVYGGNVRRTKGACPKHPCDILPIRIAPTMIPLIAKPRRPTRRNLPTPPRQTSRSLRLRSRRRLQPRHQRHRLSGRNSTFAARQTRRRILRPPQRPPINLRTLNRSCRRQSNRKPILPRIGR